MLPSGSSIYDSERQKKASIHDTEGTASVLFVDRSARFSSTPPSSRPLDALFLSVRSLQQRFERLYDNIGRKTGGRLSQSVCEGGGGGEIQNSTPFIKTADMTVPTKTARMKTSPTSAA